jgi:hypothetical protein
MGAGFTERSDQGVDFALIVPDLANIADIQKSLVVAEQPVVLIQRLSGLGERFCRLWLALRGQAEQITGKLALLLGCLSCHLVFSAWHSGQARRAYRWVSDTRRTVAPGECQ